MSCFVNCVSTFINIIILKHYSKLHLPPAFCYSFEVLDDAIYAVKQMFNSFAKRFITLHFKLITVR